MVLAEAAEGAGVLSYVRVWEGELRGRACAMLSQDFASNNSRLLMLSFHAPSFGALPDSLGLLVPWRASVGQAGLVV